MVQKSNIQTGPDSGGAGQKYGDQYVFVALDADRKLISALHVGKRKAEIAHSFMREL